MKHTVLLLVATLFISPIARTEDEKPKTLDAYLSRLASEKDGKARQLLFYGLKQALEARRIAVTSTDDATRLATVIADLMEHDTERITRWLAAEFLAAHAHPAAREALFRVASPPGQASLLARTNALAGLVSLRDPRVLPLLAAERPLPAHLIAELGLPEGVAVLEQTIADPTRDVRETAAATRALRDLRLFLDSKMVNSFDLDDHALSLLKENGFALVPGDKNEMFELYEAAYPFVTSDVVFHTFMILMRATFSEMESLVLAPRVGELSRRLAVACVDQATRLADARLAAAARSNAAFFAVPAALIVGVDPGTLGLPADLEKKVREELARIQAHAAIGRSTLFDRDEDFTKYLPRGRHASIPELEGYFQGMLYLGRMMFQLASDDETRRAILLVAAIDERPELRSEWTAIDALVGQLFGERDDLAFPDYENVARHVAGGASPKDFERIARDDALRLALVAELRTRPGPRIDTLGMKTSGGRQRSAGLRVFGQRYSRPIDLFQQYLEHGRWPPSGLHVAAELFGSKRAREILHGSGFAEGPGIFAVPALATDPFASLMDGTIECARSLFRLESGAPAFMRKPAWEEKQINSALGGWAEVQHATTLYTKDGNLYLSASGMIDRFHGYVEPVPRFYSSLSTLLARILSQSDACGLFERIAKDKEATLAKLGPSPTPDSLKPGETPDYATETRRTEAKIRLERRDVEEFASILAHLESLATRELRGEPQTIDDGFFLKGLHRQLMALSFNRSGTNVAQTSMALITDVASEYQSGQCLEVGVARPWLIYAAVPDDGRTFVCKGAAYSYSEFTQPIRERLDDGRWREMSKNLAESKHLPWIATRPELGFVWTLTRSEIEGLRSLTDMDGSNRSGGAEPWRGSDYENQARFLAGATVAPGDLDLLLELAEQDRLNLSIRGFVLQRLADFGTDPRVRAEFESQIQRVEAKSSYLVNLDACRLYYSIRGLGSCGLEARPIIERAVVLVERVPKYARAAFDAALRETRESIAANPKGRSRTP